MANPSLDLSKIFSAVQGTLAQNQSGLNQADTYNHNHGDNMVEIFQVVTQAVREKQDAAPADQLKYASQQLRTKSTSGSGQLYSEGLARAATAYQGKQVTPNNAIQLITALLGSQTNQQQPAAAAQDPLGGLLSGLMGGEQAAGTGQDPLGGLLSGLMGGEQPQQQTAGPGQDSLGGLAGSLLSGLMGGEAAPTEGQQAGFDAGDLLNAGMAFMQAKQQGASSMEALTKALIAASPLSGSQHREQSGSLIANTLFQVIGSMTKK